MHRIIRPEKHIRNVDGAVVFDGDGDGTGAAAIWLMKHPGDYLAFSNRRKTDRDLVKRVLHYAPASYWRGKNIGIFDIAVEDNLAALEELARTGSSIDYVDHHTIDFNLIPKNVNNYCQIDNRTVSSSLLAFNMTGISNPKAEQLAIIGLANDGKDSAIKNFGQYVSRDEKEELSMYARAINFGSGNATLDSVLLLDGLHWSDIPLEYLRMSGAVNNLVIVREKIIKDLMDRAQHYSANDRELILLPHSSEEDRENAFGAYNELANSLMHQNPQKLYIIALQTPNDRWRFAFRCADEFRNAKRYAEVMAGVYEEEAGGRIIAAGFSTPKQVDINSFWDQLRKVQ